MSKVNELFEKELCVVNFGIESFYQDLKKQNVKSVHVAWKPVAGGDKKIAGYLKQLKDPNLAEKIAAANKEALRRILAAQPALVGMSTAGEAIPGMTKTTILHAGPPVKWEDMCGPMKGAVMGGLIYEGLAKDMKEAEELAGSGKITFDSCHHHNAVGPMAGIVTYSMPVWHVVNKTFGNDAYCTMNEGLGKVLRFGACDEEVFDRLRKMEKVYYPVLKEALEIHGEIDMKVMIAQALQMGDEGHNRNKAGTSLFIREILSDVYKTHFPLEQQQEAIAFINGNDHAFLNLSMPSCKATMDRLWEFRTAPLFLPCAEMVWNLASGFPDLAQTSGLRHRPNISAVFISRDIPKRTQIRISEIAVLQKQPELQGSVWQLHQLSYSL